MKKNSVSPVRFSVASGKEIRPALRAEGLTGDEMQGDMRRQANRPFQGNEHRLARQKNKAKIVLA